jgi:hypothetical protein
MLIRPLAGEMFGDRAHNHLSEDLAKLSGTFERLID